MMIPSLLRLVMPIDMTCYNKWQALTDLSSLSLVAEVEFVLDIGSLFGDRFTWPVLLLLIPPFMMYKVIEYYYFHLWYAKLMQCT
jgi:hypothetical protein